MEVYKVIGKVKTPIRMDSPLHLDALLNAKHPGFHNLGCRPDRSDTNTSSIKTMPLPLCSARSNSTDKYDWVWAASAAEFPDNAIISQDAITKRWTPEDIHNLQRVLPTAKGSTRNRFVKFSTIITPEIYFYCVTNQAKELKRILKRVDFVGGLRAQGYGRVISWDFVELDSDSINSIVKNGVCRRRLPSSFGVDNKESILRLSVKSPYWHNCIKVPAYEVGTKVTVSEKVVIV